MRLQQLRKLLSAPMWSTVNFKRFKGKSLPQVVLSDPDWFFWALEKKIFRGTLAEEAKLIARRARRMKIPKKKPENWRNEHVIGIDGKYAGFEIVRADHPRHTGSSKTIREPTLDFSFPRQVRPYDKLGCKLMIKAFRYDFCRNEKLTKQKCEAFFDNPQNFA